ncbi:MAG TPA: type II secretion system F family protein [Candidatus Woesearchaeota archaeon]|nr:type II secretion system F family protein [Candidatus Woesearchaeota archaeon]
MKKKAVFPFLPIPFERAVKLAAPFKPMARNFAKRNLKFKKELLQAEIKVKAEDYLAVSVLSSFIVGLIVFVVVLLMGLYGAFKNPVPIALLLGVLLGSANQIYSMVYPKILIKTKVQMIERDLLFALRYILLRIRSGVPLYDAMVSVASGGYGEVSNEFNITIKEISSGAEEVNAIESMALRSPSAFFRRTVWQIANNIRAGSDIADVLDTITATLAREHTIMVRKYGSELNPLILMYMMFTIIIPSLGTVVIVIMSSFAGVAVPTSLFYIIPVVILFLQIMFLSAIKARRPLVSI